MPCCEEQERPAARIDAVARSQRGALAAVSETLAPQ